MKKQVGAWEIRGRGLEDGQENGVPDRPNLNVGNQRPGGFAVLDNHLHLLLRLDSPRAAAWSAAEVARRWLTLFPIRDAQGRPLPTSEERVRTLATDAAWIATIRRRLACGITGQGITGHAGNHRPRGITDRGITDHAGNHRPGESPTTHLR